MKRNTAALVLYMALSALLLAGCGIFSAFQAAPDKDERLLVATTIYPLTCIAQEIGGDRVTVTTLLPAGGSAHLHEVGPAMMQEAVSADLLIRIAGGLDEWAEQVFSTAREDAASLEIATVLAEDGGEDLGDPHVWLDPILVRDHIVPLLVNAFSAVDPEGSVHYVNNAARFTDELTDLDRELQDMFQDVTGRSFISDHAAWTHFAHRYNLEQRGVLETTPGHECSPREATELVDLANHEGIHVITTTRGHGTMLAEALAGQIDGILLDLDPLGDPDSADRNSYAQIMRYNAAKLAAALHESVEP